MRAVGAHQGLSPVLDILATLAEDGQKKLWRRPYLVSQMASAYIRSQGEDFESGIIATAKHFPVMESLKEEGI